MTASSPTIRFATEAGKFMKLIPNPDSRWAIQIRPPNNKELSKQKKKSDVPLILSLIHELAAYENASSSVLATESSLLATLSFDDPASSSSPPSRGYARTLLIFPPPSPSSPSSSSSYPTTTTTTCAGMALYYTSYSTWLASPGIFLEDLYIRPEFRKRGFGKLLIQRLAREVVEISSGGDGGKGGGRTVRGRLEWNVLKWNEPSLDFYQNLGAVRLDEWVGMRVDGDKLVELAGQGGEEGRVEWNRNGFNIRGQGGVGFFPGLCDVIVTTTYIYIFFLFKNRQTMYEQIK